MALVSWSKVVGKAMEAGVEVKEITLCGCLVGYEIGGREVRHDTRGWFYEKKVDEAIQAAQLRAAA